MISGWGGDMSQNNMSKGEMHYRANIVLGQGSSGDISHRSSTGANNAMDGDMYSRSSRNVSNANKGDFFQRSSTGWPKSSSGDISHRSPTWVSGNTRKGNGGSSCHISSSNWSNTRTGGYPQRSARGVIDTQRGDISNRPSRVLHVDSYGKRGNISHKPSKCEIVRKKKHKVVGNVYAFGDENYVRPSHLCLKERTKPVYTEHTYNDIKTQIRSCFYRLGARHFRPQYGASIANYAWTRDRYMDREQADMFLQTKCPDLLSNEMFEYNIMVACMIKFTQLIIDRILVLRKYVAGRFCNYASLTYHTSPYVLRSDITNVEEMNLPGVMDRLNVISIQDTSTFSLDTERGEEYMMKSGNGDYSDVDDSEDDDTDDVKPACSYTGDASDSTTGDIAMQAETTIDRDSTTCDIAMQAETTKDREVCNIVH